MNRKIKIKCQEQKALSLSIKTDYNLKLQYNDCMTVRKDASLSKNRAHLTSVHSKSKVISITIILIVQKSIVSDSIWLSNLRELLIQ